MDEKTICYDFLKIYETPTNWIPLSVCFLYFRRSPPPIAGKLFIQFDVGHMFFFQTGVGIVQLPTVENCVDGRNPAPVEVGSLSHYFQGFVTSQVVVGEN